MPSYSRNYSKCFLKELVAKRHIFNKILINWASLIACDPTAIYEFKPSSLNKIGYLVSHVIILTIPPCLEKPDFCMSKASIRIFPKVIYYICQDPIYCSVIIFHGCTSPPGVLMRMRYYMQSLFCCCLLQKS